MAEKFLHLSFPFPESEKARPLESIFDMIAQDWLRYLPNCWILYTDRSATDVFYFLKPFFGPSDQFLIVGLDMKERNGWLPQWIWEWMDKKRQLGPPPPPQPPPNDFVKTLGEILGKPPVSGGTALTRGLFGGFIPPPEKPKK